MPKEEVGCREDEGPVRQIEGGLMLGTKAEEQAIVPSGAPSWLGSVFRGKDRGHQ